MQTATQAEETLTDLATGFPRWHIWRGRDGRGADKGWYATRRRRLVAAELEAGLAATLGADDAASLYDLLAQQQVIEQQTAGDAP